MELTAIHKRVVGLDVHQAQITACAILEAPDGEVRIEQRQFGGFKKDRQALAHWVQGQQPELVVMESTGIYWKGPYASLEALGISATVVNARHVKQVPGRKTDIADAQWLAMLARAGLLRGRSPSAPMSLTRSLSYGSKPSERMNSSAWSIPAHVKLSGK